MEDDGAVYLESEDGGATGAMVRGGAGDASAGSPAANLRRIRPAADGLAMQDLRARTEKVLFGTAEPARFGRYVLLGRVAGGGMGVVYGAYDPDLHRKVALKVLHPHLSEADGGRQRLIGEARALAMLDHPNVVKVHDVLTHEGQVVLVMAFVDGQTLSEWQLAEHRTSQELVRVYLRAGEGLAAAHDVHVVHRDFKPANTIIGNDGRVQVLDFGLARLTRGEPTPVAHVLDSLDLENSALTATGEVAGTLGYTAPEQLAGAPATQASDQFSFCVSLHRALEGVPPFNGKDLAALRASIHRATIAYARDGRVVPKWLRAVIRRGLSADPANRYASMRGLLDQLGRQRGWRRWRKAVIVTVMTATTGVALVTAMRSTDPQAACDGGAADLASVWTAAHRAQINKALDAVGTPYASAIRERVLNGLDGYKDAWGRTHRGACQVHRRGAISSDMLDKQMLCLARRLNDLGASIHILEQIDRVSVIKAVDVVVRLPPVAACSDIEMLDAASDPPARPQPATEVDTIRKELSRAAALDRVGRDRDALTVVDAALARAEKVDYPPVEVEAALLKGRVLLFSQEYKAAFAPLTRAEQLALEHRMYAAAVEAAARRFYCEANEGAEIKDLEPQIVTIDAISRGVRGDHFARPLLLNNIGAVYLARKQRDRALQYFEAARIAIEDLEHPDLELTSIENNVALLTPDPVRREALARRAWQRVNDELGAANPLTLEILDGYANHVVDPAVALKLTADACRLYDEYHPAQLARRARCACRHAFLAAELGDTDSAAVLYRSVVAFTAGATAADAVTWRHIAAGHVHLEERHLPEVLEELNKVVDDYAQSANWWERRRAAHALLGIGLAEHTLGDDRDALAPLERAVTSYEEFTRINEEVENHQRLALSRLTLGGALLRLGRSRDRAIQLRDQAIQYYRTASPDVYRRRIEDTEER